MKRMIEIRFVEIISFKAKFSSTETGFTGNLNALLEKPQAYRTGN